MMHKRQRAAPHNPRSLEELQLNPDEIKTYSNKSFLFCDTGPGPNRIVLFATKESIEYLYMSSIWLADGTFNALLSFANCMYTVHCLVGRPNPFKNGHLLPSIRSTLKQDAIYIH